MLGYEAEFWQAVSALAAIFLIGITGFYAYLTFRLVQNAEEQSWQLTRARIIVKMTTNQGGQLFLLHFENIGATSAENLRISLDKPVHRKIDKNENLQELPFIKNGLSSFPPAEPIQYALGVGYQWLSDETDKSIHPDSFLVHLTYNTGGREISEAVPINIYDQYMMSSVPTDYLEDFGRNFPDKFTRSMDILARHLSNRVDKKPPQMIARKSWPTWFVESRSYNKR